MAALLRKYTASGVSTTTDIGVMDMRYHSYLSYQANISGSLSGVLQLWVSNDGINFVQKTDAAKSISPPVAPATSKTYFIEIANPCLARFYKFTMYVSSGSGDVSVIAVVKGDA